MNNKDTYVVFGGANGWGKRIYDVLADDHNVDIIEKESTPKDVYNAISKHDVTVLAIPDSEINSVLLEAEDILITGKAIVDCATNKNGFSETLSRLSVSGASVCSTHPMVKPGSSPRGQNVILMPVGTNQEKAKDAAALIFHRMGMNLEEFDFSQHSDAMVILQMVPHLIQRILIDALGNGITEKSMSVSDISRLAPANYLLSELGLGRVASQRPDVSAGIVATALETRFGRRILGGIQETLGKIISAGDDRNQLANLFQQGATRLDQGGHWRKSMDEKTEVALIRLGNLRSRSFVADATNSPGILSKILCVLDEFGLDMTALDSQVLYDEKGNLIARFDIGITDHVFDQDELEKSMKKIGVSVHEFNIRE